MLRETQNEIVIYYLAGTMVVLALIIIVIVYVFLHQKKTARLRLKLQEEEHKQRQAVFNALQDGQEKERSRLAEELHDGIGAKLSGLKMSLEYLKSKIADKEYIRLAHTIFTGITETIDELREVTHNLQSAFSYGKDMQQSLLDFIEQLNSKNECHYQLYYDYQVNTIDKYMQHNCYRIIAELLLNIQKHAQAAIASVQINVEEPHLELIIEDNGKGFPNQDNISQGIGISNIKNRVKIFNGVINIDSSANGTTIIIQLPLNQSHE